MVTFETTIFEKDWEVILKTGYLEKMIARCNYGFQRKVLIVNNVKNRKDVESVCQSKKRDGIINDFYFVEDYDKEVLDFFDIDPLSFRGGRIYSMPPLVGIYLCETRYLLRFTGDSIIINDHPWIDESISLMDGEIISAAPKVDFYDERNPIRIIGDFQVTKAFSDQCFLADTDVFKKKIYNYTSEYTSNYPAYAGQPFERRIADFMFCENKFMITNTKALYTSKNFEKGHDIFNIAKNRP